MFHLQTLKETSPESPNKHLCYAYVKNRPLEFSFEYLTLLTDTITILANHFMEINIISVNNLTSRKWQFTVNSTLSPFPWTDLEGRIPRFPWSKTRHQFLAHVQRGTWPSSIITCGVCGHSNTTESNCNVNVESVCLLAVSRKLISAPVIWFCPLYDGNE
jgi:hypothetical protein